MFKIMWPISHTILIRLTSIHNIINTSIITDLCPNYGRGLKRVSMSD